MIYCIDLFLPFHLQMYVLHVDEEIGGSTGMKQFVKTDDFKAMNLGFALDEGMGILRSPHLPPFLLLIFRTRLQFRSDPSRAFWKRLLHRLLLCLMRVNTLMTL